MLNLSRLLRFLTQEKGRSQGFVMSEQFTSQFKSDTVIAFS